MIVSASYRTDIPAFYGEWFLNRFRAGWVRVVNPHGGQISTIPLRAGVDGIVFWTRNIGPFLPALEVVRDVGMPFVVQHTVTGYPRVLERRVIAVSRAIDQIHDLARRHGPAVAVWRYDPVLLTNQTPPAWHLDRFAALAEGLTGAVDEVTLSFATFYRKSERNLAATGTVAWHDPSAEEKRSLLRHLVAIAAARGLTVSLCAQTGRGVEGAVPGRCVDARRLERVAAGWGRPWSVSARPRGTRPGCGCHESRDIGAYDTCPHGCAYCYAVGSPDLARRRFADHDPRAEFLIAPTVSSPPGPPTLL